MAMTSTRIVRTPRGSTLDSVGANVFRACDRYGHCRLVMGLSNAQDTLRVLEQGIPGACDRLLPRPIRKPLSDA